LTAVQRALEIASKDTDVRIMTDSAYSINCSTVWYTSWKKNGWKTSQGGSVLNKDLVVEIRKLIDERNTKGAKTDFEWIAGHSGDPGNEAADKLAVAGAMANAKHS
jgi:ribonuclease HI